MSWKQNYLDWLRPIRIHSLSQGKGSDSPEHVASTYLNKSELCVEEEVTVLPPRVSLFPRLCRAGAYRSRNPEPLDIMGGMGALTSCREIITTPFIPISFLLHLLPYPQAQPMTLLRKQSKEAPYSSTYIYIIVTPLPFLPRYV